MRFVVWLAVALAGTVTAKGTKPEASGRAPAKPTVKRVQQTVSKSTKTSSACFYDDYTPKADAGPSDDSVQKRSIGGRILIEKRKLNEVPTKFGNCEFAAKAAGLKYRNNPTVDNVLNNINGAGAIPKWFSLNDDCKAAPGFDVVGDSPARKDKVQTVTANGRVVEIPKYNVDHVWELKLMTKFFESVLPGPKSPGATLTCADFEASFLVTGAKPADQPLQKLYDRMPQALERPRPEIDTLEFAGTSVELNAKKARILTPKADASSLFGFNHLASLQNIKDKIHALRTVSTTIAMMNDGRVVKLFDRAQDRLKVYMGEVDTRIANPANKLRLSRTGFTWTDAFKKWMEKYIADRGDETWTWVRDMMLEVQKDINKMPSKTEAEKTRKALHQEYLDTFKKSAYSKQSHYTVKWKA
ncbi:hypothetical protein BU25DRAFT_466749 [Macroventuria anomochaeta]|uniref:Uncharacterized protein n=1 Tax=Macroventuria anomochaeta TaxID=301207 RepID=A0ACB6S628_9PLEO|nr:uncharacterized protein BU25DRAFT_466749 [Macroventuria anomochaeta]KAF2628844.1 hypothetical protein BU25DRAFT_466749 [Macroventuria anomochaeta]